MLFFRGCFSILIILDTPIRGSPSEISGTTFHPMRYFAKSAFRCSSWFVMEDIWNPSIVRSQLELRTFRLAKRQKIGMPMKQLKLSENNPCFNVTRIHGRVIVMNFALSLSCQAILELVSYIPSWAKLSSFLRPLITYSGFWSTSLRFKQFAENCRSILSEFGNTSLVIMQASFECRCLSKVVEIFLTTWLLVTGSSGLI